MAPGMRAEWGLQGLILRVLNAEILCCVGPAGCWGLDGVLINLRRLPK